MKRIVYSIHLRFRLKLRIIPRSLPLKIYRLAKEHYFDTGTLKHVAVTRTRFKGKMREMAVVYREEMERVVLISIHPLKIFQKTNRIKSGLWKRI